MFKIYKNSFKRVFDVAFATILLILLFPILTIITLLLLISNERGKAFFTQERPGKDEKIFKLYKFKSMTDKRDKNGNLLPDAQRITKVGRFVRKTSLDELPQLWNVLKGDMSFVGPRPLLVCYLPYYTQEEHRRHNVRPGITGLSQISGRNHLGWDERLAIDVKYVDNISCSLDIRILLLTIKKVFKKEDIIVVLDPKINIPLNIYRNGNRD